jgi:hypothetical protein
LRHEGIILCINARAIGIENQIIASLKTKQEQKLKQKRENEELNSFTVDSDSEFGFIAGYTSGGIPYGLTHEEITQITEDVNTNIENDKIEI